jgi:hypothetical protein
MKITQILLFVGLILLSANCGNRPKDLASIEKQELASGIRNDSIFLGIHLGMPKQGFFDYCWGMNKKGQFTEGEGMTVEHDLGKRNFAYPIQMNFYPKFKNDKVNELPIKFTYKGIDISYPNGQTEKLLKDVKKLAEVWYGEGFFITTLPDGVKSYAKVSGNRKVLIFSEKEYEVMVVVTDLAMLE